MRPAQRILLAGALLIAGPLVSGAQAHSAASRSSDISAFGTYQFAKPDFGPYTNTGGTLGLDLTHYLRILPIAASIEARGNYSTGQSITERSLLGGLRLKYDYHRYHPYADFLGGGGTVKFASNLAPAYTSDRGFVLSYGGGLDIDVIRHFQLKLDLQSQYYNLGAKVSSQPGDGTFNFSPTVFGIGLSYVIPFRPHNKRE